MSSLTPRGLRVGRPRAKLGNPTMKEWPAVTYAYRVSAWRPRRSSSHNDPAAGQGRGTHALQDELLAAGNRVLALVAVEVVVPIAPVHVVVAVERDDRVVPPAGVDRVVVDIGEDVIVSAQRPLQDLAGVVGGDRVRDLGGGQAYLSGLDHV